MSSKDSLNVIGKAASHRKRKRRKWKKSVSSNFVDSCNSDDFRESGYGMIPVWYWSNYFKAVEWQNKHNVALWKSYALGLQYENRNLLMILKQHFPNGVFDAPLTFHNLEVTDKIPCETNEFDDVESEDSGSGNGEVEFEMSEEMVKFFEQSIKHKMEMKRLKEEREECVCIDANVKELSEADNRREKEMKLLYGDGSSMIIGMETAIQLSFDKYCYMKSPKYWPNIPLNM